MAQIIGREKEQEILREAFHVEETKTRKSCQLVMITTYGLQNNQYVGMIQKSLTMDDLFS